MARSDLRAKIRLEGDASGATKAIKQTESGFKGLGTAIKRGAIAMVAALAAVVGAVKLLESAGERLGQKRSLERTLKAQGINADEFVGKLKNLANQQIATSDIILSSNRALALGIAADDIPGLLEAATKASVALGISATAAFNDITTGVGRASPLILDNLGIVVDAVKVYASYAESIGVTTEELTKQQKTAALSAAVMKNAAKGAEDFEKAQSKVTVALAQSKTKLKEWFQQSIDSIAQNEALAKSIGRVTSEMNLFVAAARATAGTFLGLIPGQGKMADSLRKSIPLWKSTTAGVVEAIGVWRSYGKEVLATEAAQEKMRLALIEVDAAYDRARESVEGLTQAQIDAEARTKRIEASLLAEATALDKLRAAIGEVTQAELQKELDEITTALEAARIETGGNTAAFLEMEAKVVPAIDHMKARIKGLASGLGDIGEAADDASGEFNDLGNELKDAADSTDLVTNSTRSATSALEREAAQANRTAASLRTLTRVEESLALAQARTALRQTQRERGVRGSSGPSGIGSYGLSPFGTGGRVEKVDADGILRPA